MRADLLAGCSGTEWNPKDSVALVTDYRCRSEGIWRDRMERDGSGLGEESSIVVDRPVLDDHAVVTGEQLDGALGVVAVGCIPDLGQRLPRASLHRLG